MPDIKYKYKTKNVKKGNFLRGMEYIKPDKIIQPAVIYRYAFLRSIFNAMPGESSIQQVSYYSILNFPKLKSRFFNIKDVTTNPNLDLSAFNSQFSGISFDYYHSAP